MDMVHVHVHVYVHVPVHVHRGQSRTGRHLLYFRPVFLCNHRGQVATIIAQKYRTKTEEVAQPQASQTAQAPWATETGAAAVQSRTGRHLP